MITIKGSDVIAFCGVIFLILCTIYTGTTMYNHENVDKIKPLLRIPFIFGGLGLLIVAASICYYTVELLHLLSKKEFKINTKKLKL